MDLNGSSSNRRSSTQGDILNVTIPSHGHTNWYNSFVPSNTGIGLGLGFGLPVIGGSEYQLPEALEVDQHQKEIEETVRLVGIQAGVPAQDIPREEQGADVTPLISTPECESTILIFSWGDQH